MSEKILHIDADQFESVVLKGTKVVVDFYSTECPPCEAFAAKFEPLSEIYGKDIVFVKIFRQKNRELAEKLDVRSSPTVLFYENGIQQKEVLRGAIKRKDLIKNLDQLLTSERVKELHSVIKPKTTECDLLILGGGPAGLTAAIYGAQAQLKTILLDKNLPGGQVSTTHQVSNFPGFIDPQPGYMLMHFMGEQSVKAGVLNRVSVDITSVNLEKKEVIIDDIETIRAKKIIVSTGSSPNPLGIPGEKEFKGQGISYCATCDAKYFQNKHVIVIGGGNSAIEESLFIAKFATKLTIVHQFDKLQANKMAQKKAFEEKKINFMFQHEPREFIKNPDGTMTAVLENLKTKERFKITADGIFVFVGMKPNLDEFKGLFELDQWGYVKVDQFMHTNVPDVFAAGDVASKPYRQITVAVAEGTVAAITAARELG
jgi:thioredoxin reductase (NADPH)